VLVVCGGAWGRVVGLPAGRIAEVEEEMAIYIGSLSLWWADETAAGGTGPGDRIRFFFYAIARIHCSCRPMWPYLFFLKKKVQLTSLNYKIRFLDYSNS
jgi:hypothetical protein